MLIKPEDPFGPQIIEMNVPTLKAISRRHNKTLTFYDLETTNLVHTPTFGITDIGAICIHPTGLVTKHAMLINPENPISEIAEEVTGINQDMVKNEPTFREGPMEYFQRWANNNIMLGFNSISFDDRGIRKEFERYGGGSITFQDSRDVRSMWRIKTGSGGGKLSEIAEYYGIENVGAHRAIYDVAMTIRILEKMLYDNPYGVSLFDHPGAKMGAHRAVEHIFRQHIKKHGDPMEWVNQEERVVDIVERCGWRGTDRLADMVAMDTRECQKLIDDLIKNGVIDCALVEDTMAQKFFNERVPVVIEKAWAGKGRGQAKPIMTLISEYMKLGLLPLHNGSATKPALATYSQLYVYLKINGYYAALEKSEDRPAKLNSDNYSYVCTSQGPSEVLRDALESISNN